VTAEKMVMTLREPSIYAEGLTVTTSDKKIVATIAILSANTTWDAMHSDKQQWKAAAKNGVINVHNLKQASKPETNPEKNTNTPPTIVNLHDILQVVDISLSDITINLKNNQSVYVEYIHRLGTHQPNPLEINQQGLEFFVDYNADKQTILSLTGEIVSSINEDGIAELIITTPSLDLRKLIAGQKKISTGSSATPIKVINTEPIIDWSPLSSLAPLSISFASEKITLPQGTVNQLRSQVIINNQSSGYRIQQQHNAAVDLNIKNEIAIQQTITINTDWQTLDKRTQGVDIKGKTDITIGDSHISADGKLNLNGIIQEELTVAIDTTQLPIKGLSKQLKTIEKDIAIALPLTLSADITFTKNKLSLNNLLLAAKDSDINGNISFALRNDTTSIKAIDFDITSKKIVLPKGKKRQPKKTANKKLFSDSTLPTEWLKTLSVNGELTIERLNYNGKTIASGINSDIALNNQKLAINSRIGRLAKGSFDFTLAIAAKGNNLQVTSKATAKNIIVEALNISPKEVLSGGKTNIDLSLNSYGNSQKMLAANLQGNLLLTSTEGVISNNSFEAIGSDVLLKLINTLNPFYKESTTTNLECAVVKSTINNGKMLFDDSIAIKTSRMIIIADGEVDLSTEQINLGINPKARQGVGIDVASLAKFVALQGPLTNPSIGVSGEGTAKSLLSIGAAISTGGLSLLATKLADTVISGDPCEVAKAAFTKIKK
jgi:hypothetical protein